MFILGTNQSAFRENEESMWLIDTPVVNLIRRAIFLRPDGYRRSTNAGRDVSSCTCVLWRRELSIAIHTKRTIVVARRYQKCCVRNSKCRQRPCHVCSASCFDFVIFFRTGWVTRKRHKQNTFKSRLEYQYWTNSSDKNVIYVRLAAIFCIFCI